MLRIRSAIVSAIVCAPALFGAACSSGAHPGGEAVATNTPGGGGLTPVDRRWYREFCPMTARLGVAKCMSHVVTDAAGTIVANATPQGYGPPDLVSAYKLPSAGGSGKTIAIVDAQDDPNAESDLAVYRNQYGLPPCTTANGCFKKVNQTGGTSPLPSADSGWAGEISLDLDMASAVCPSCKILLVEATSADMADLGAAVNEAAALGATVISNSYGGPEDSTTASESAQYFNHPGVLITASTGDSGYGASFPATSEHVLAVGGTSLKKGTSARGWTETVWNSGGSGCSAYVAKPAYQTQTACSKRAEADVSAVADPNTGLAVYDSYGGEGGWIVVGGTSASSPIVASIFALSGEAAAATPQFPWSNPSWFFDVTSGSNGSCSPSLLCNAASGWDGPTGWGTPNVAAWSVGSGSSSGGSSSSSSGGSSSSSSGGSSSSSSGGSSSSSSGGSSSSSSGGSSSSSGGSSSSSGGGTCTHPICSTGTKLTKTCDPCAAEICAADSYCCNNKWDAICVGEVGSICGESCTGGGSSSSSGGSSSSSGGGTGGTCKHSECNTGAKLASGCDTCATEICSVDSYCCQVTWDSICVGEAGSVCGETCP